MAGIQGIINTFQQSNLPN